MKSDYPIPTDVKSILKVLVSYDTTSRNSNLPIIEWIEHYLSHYSVAYTRYNGGDEGKWNLHAIIGPQRSGGIAFSGHVDCVPVDDQKWSSDPFVLREENGLLYGRGTADMKGFVACVLSSVPDFIKMDLPYPIHLFFTCDEEITCDGARYLMKDIQAAHLLPEICIVGEPTMLSPVIAHKGRYAVRINLTGKSGHSSVPELGRNALHAMGRAIAICADQADFFLENGRQVIGFTPPYTTMQVGIAKGGSILNIIPEHASFEVEWRNVPGDEGEEEFQKLKQLLDPLDQELRIGNPTGGIEYEVLVNLPPLSLSETSFLVDMTCQTTGKNTVGFVSYGTEAGIYQRAGLESIVCGPSDIAQAHRPDEFIAISQLQECERVLKEFALKANVTR
ncbi:acetylornithine deacetylase [Swingsia samuiensis]|uniref:Acetylornithine deacetylase n=1 Tax=Swingsia samuiensis TaxID=1293412 RepID=A0A4Y6UJT4_9PROT|nr:acetylornithine deacetylase [Swingsia samuiensis]QDH17853.1 acetylornithine deacetylase [Swingsia samuiensis]